MGDLKIDTNSLVSCFAGADEVQRIIVDGVEIWSGFNPYIMFYFINSSSTPNTIEQFIAGTSVWSYNFGTDSYGFHKATTVGDVNENGTLFGIWSSGGFPDGYIFKITKDKTYSEVQLPTFSHWGNRYCKILGNGNVLVFRHPDNSTFPQTVRIDVYNSSLVHQTNYNITIGNYQVFETGKTRLYVYGVDANYNDAVSVYNPSTGTLISTTSKAYGSYTYIAQLMGLLSISGMTMNKIWAPAYEKNTYNSRFVQLNPYTFDDEVELDIYNPPTTTFNTTYPTLRKELYYLIGKFLNYSQNEYKWRMVQTDGTVLWTYTMATINWDGWSYLDVPNGHFYITERIGTNSYKIVKLNLSNGLVLNSSLKTTTTQSDAQGNIALKGYMDDLPYNQLT